MPPLPLPMCAGCSPHVSSCCQAGVLDSRLLQADAFYNQCDPNKTNLCLYGYADGTWEVRA